eukprot:569440-Alexandrium_andersonii.AAC.1
MSLRGEWRGAHPSGASGAKFEVLSGSRISGLRRISARTGLWPVADCALGSLLCEDARSGRADGRS